MLVCLAAFLVIFGVLLFASAFTPRSEPLLEPSLPIARVARHGRSPLRIPTFRAREVGDVIGRATGGMLIGLGGGLLGLWCLMQHVVLFGGG
ncbi:MAG TPA: hypothetical protein VGM39_23945 [Kofleriaceae bacterium]|jgi:hypothetical protein